MRAHNLTKILSLALFALFICALLLTLVAGALVYSQLISEKAVTDESRYANGVLVNSVRGADVFDAITEATGPEGEALVLVERTDSGVFETRIYGYEGAIVQEYSPENKDFMPEDAIEIMKSSTFDFQYEDGLLTIETDEGETDIYIRSAGRFEEKE